MIYLGRFCIICLKKGEKLEKLSMVQENSSYHDKLATLIPQMVRKIAIISHKILSYVYF